MKRMLAACSAAALTVLVGTCLALPASAQENRGAASSGGERGGGGGGGGASTAAPSGGGGSSAGGSSTGSTTSGGGSGSSSSGGGWSGGGGGPRSGAHGGGATGGTGLRSESNGGGTAVSGGGDRGGDRGDRGGDRGDRGGRATTGSSSGSGTTSSGTGTANGATSTGGTRAAHDGGARNPRTQDATDGVPSYARPRDGRPVIGIATPRTGDPGGTTTKPGVVVLYPGGYYGGFYDPYGYGGFGYGGYGYGYGGDYGGFYDPWYGGYPTYQSNAVYKEEGALKLKIKPREAEVYVDGYYVGIVDDFDGLFQKLRIETGPHRIEVRAPGYEALAFDVRITTDHSTTYQGELKKIQ
ncbi:MAG: PEGA domain-containing protein [Acidobacteria bacterium]|nr:PEGA domain-containing protein [Acidobacteriota bacterium]